MDPTKTAFPIQQSIDFDISWLIPALILPFYDRRRAYLRVAEPVAMEIWRLINSCSRCRENDFEVRPADNLVGESVPYCPFIPGPPQTHAYLIKYLLS